MLAYTSPQRSVMDWTPSSHTRLQLVIHAGTPSQTSAQARMIWVFRMISSWWGAVILTVQDDGPFGSFQRCQDDLNPDSQQSFSNVSPKLQNEIPKCKGHVISGKRPLPGSLHTVVRIWAQWQDYLCILGPPSSWLAPRSDHRFENPRPERQERCLGVHR